MNTSYYLSKFQHALDSLDKAPFIRAGLDLKAGNWLNCSVLKLQKPAWNNPNTKPFEGGIFFSVWLSDESISQGRLYYNIHALKLRELKAYRIAAREFAGAFRARFEMAKHDWPNVSTNFGPLTLMEGWVDFDEARLEYDVVVLAEKFLPVVEIIDGLLKFSIK